MQTRLFWGAHVLTRLTTRGITTLDESQKSESQDASTIATEVVPRIKFKRLDKTATHIMQAGRREAVEEVRTQREIPDIRPGYIIQLRLEVHENKRRVSTVKGIVIAGRNVGLNTTIRLRRLVAGVGVESLLPLMIPNVKEIKVLDKKKVRRAKLYYLRDKMNALKK
ncbi:50S ribosomal protein L19, chloroplastic-like [Helianthus annuus]|uniref:50S ribosomal protein L19, chloroplastic-like n=1 Tax=Helianthus annuus TaxID=4232 RepID=UPI000B8F82E8|nr:50S ribosomal protein L19, chloroplastic-like [Helianthus annuus]